MNPLARVAVALRRARAGAALSLTLAGCVGPAPEPVENPDTTLRDSLGIDPERTVQRVSLGGAREREHVVPRTLEVVPGAVVEFYTLDHRAHSVLFLEDSLSPGALAFLQGRGGLASGPLVERGSRFVIDFQGAPPGRYPFLSRGHGEAAAGTLLVVEPPGR